MNKETHLIPQIWYSLAVNIICYFLAHLAFRPCELLSSLFVRCPSVNISHFNLLLRNHWANCNQTLVEWSLDGPLPNFCPVIPTSNQDGHQAKNRKKGGWNFNCPSQNELKFNCSYMARNSLTYIPGFSVKFFFQPIYTDYAN